MHILPKKRFSIHLKVFFSFASILLVSILITVLFGNSMMERLYINSKSHDLSMAYNKITSVLEKQNDKLYIDHSLLECLFEIEQDNVNILLFTLNDTEAQIQYFTRRSWGMDNGFPQDIVPINSRREPSMPPLFPMQFSPNQWIEDASDLGVFQSSTLPLLVTEKEQSNIGPNQTLDYYGCYTKDDTSVYIFLRTPKEAITLAAGLAVKYNLYIALVTFLLMAITSYYVTRRITRPIAEINNAADRISNMDFSQSIAVKTGDELETLSENINDMAEKLQDYIYQMQLNHQLLEKDLEREANTSRMRQEFVANVTHDFKTPLTLIRAYTETIRNQNLNDEEKVSYCDIILDENDRLNRMVTQLLQLSRLESGSIQMEYSIFSMEELLRDTLHHNQLLLQNKNISVQWECEAEDHIVQGDYVRIEQVIRNLIENAIKYTAENGEIRLSVITEQDLCRVAVTNTFEPLTEHQLENLFISFYKTDESRHLDQQSFGLGLAIVKATMDLHKQSCIAQNTPDGLQISFTLPLVVLDEEE